TETENPSFPLPSSFTMASRAALPAHLKSSAMSNGDADGAFHQKHHGKSQSHVVSKIV
ncbi:MAG: hypothetical protein Q9224_004617, partial [Gallowayella concinna]